MTRCRWQTRHPDGIECSNPAVMVSQMLPEAICSGCLLRTDPDYLSDNSRLYTLQQSQGVYVPRPRTCGGCGTVKRRADLLQFVWPYWHAGASGDEIRWSIRSVEQHYEGKA
ncbi:MAG: hypothetical protein ACK6EB_46715, partial [Planctomyces sp.]